MRFCRFCGEKECSSAAVDNVHPPFLSLTVYPGSTALAVVSGGMYARRFLDPFSAAVPFLETNQVKFLSSLSPKTGLQYYNRRLQPGKLYVIKKKKTTTATTAAWWGGDTL